MNAYSSRSNSDVAPARGGRRVTALCSFRRHRSLCDASADTRLCVSTHHVRDRPRTPWSWAGGAPALYWGIALILTACGSAGVEETQRAGERVADVNGEPILTQDIEAWSLEHAVSRDEALDALIDEALLVSEARRRGQRPDRSVLRRAAVQEILSEIEDEVSPNDVTSDAIRREYDATREQMAESDPSVVVPPLEDSTDEIRALLAGRARFARLQTLLQAPTLNEERVSRLLALPVID